MFSAIVLNDLILFFYVTSDDSKVAPVKFFIVFIFWLFSCFFFFTVFFVCTWQLRSAMAHLVKYSLKIQKDKGVEQKEQNSVRKVSTLELVLILVFSHCTHGTLRLTLPSLVSDY